MEEVWAEVRRMEEQERRNGEFLPWGLVGTWASNPPLKTLLTTEMPTSSERHQTLVQ